MKSGQTEANTSPFKSKRNHNCASESYSCPPSQPVHSRFQSTPCVAWRVGVMCSVLFCSGRFAAGVGQGDSSGVSPARSSLPPR